MKVVLRDSAVADLEDIHAWIAVERPLTADKVVDRIFASVQILELFPESGRPGRVEARASSSCLAFPTSSFMRLLTSWMRCSSRRLCTVPETAEGELSA
jgi:toxin ParE1/3/4